MTSPSELIGTAEQYERAAMMLRTRAAEQEAVLKTFGDDDYENGAVIRWTRTFGRTKVYTYAAIKTRGERIAGGSWSVTGRNSDSQISWQRLVQTHLKVAASEGQAIMVCRGNKFKTLIEEQIPF